MRIVCRYFVGVLMLLCCVSYCGRMCVERVFDVTLMLFVVFAFFLFVLVLCSYTFPYSVLMNWFGFDFVVCGFLVVLLCVCFVCRVCSLLLVSHGVRMFCLCVVYHTVLICFIELFL